MFHEYREYCGSHTHTPRKKQVKNTGVFSVLASQSPAGAGFLQEHETDPGQVHHLDVSEAAGGTSCVAHFAPGPGDTRAQR